MKYERQRTERKRNESRYIAAALAVWEAGGEKAVTAQAVGDRCGVTRQAVCKAWGSMGALRDAAARAAVATGRTGIILQMQASGHPLAPETRPERMV